MLSNKGFSTRQVHAGQLPDPKTGAVMVPIYYTSTYVQDGPGRHKGFEYSRSQNPTRFALEDCIASLEEGACGFAFASGLAASATILELLNSGDHIIAADDLYGGTYRLLSKVRAKTMNLEVSYIDLSTDYFLDRLKSELKKNTKMIWVETPTNPMLKIINLQEVAQFAKQHSLLSVCDNTFASPYLQNPLLLGFDIVVHSSTKYINGHSDVIGGLVVVKEKGDIEEKIRFLQNAIGAVPSPMDCFLVLRGLKTLSIRMEAHCKNAETIADFLQKHPKIERVYYPGLESHPGHLTAKQQMKKFGGMLSFTLKGGWKEAEKFLMSCKIFQLAESLGGVESLIEHPASMTHASIPKETREKSGISDGLIRASCGIEDTEDLLEDLEQALKQTFS